MPQVGGIVEPTTRRTIFISDGGRVELDKTAAISVAARLTASATVPHDWCPLPPQKQAFSLASIRCTECPYVLVYP